MDVEHENLVSSDSTRDRDRDRDRVSGAVSVSVDNLMFSLQYLVSSAQIKLTLSLYSAATLLGPSLC